MVDWFRLVRARLPLDLVDVSDRYLTPVSPEAGYDRHGRMVEVGYQGTTVIVSVRFPDSVPPGSNYAPVSLGLSVDLQAPVREVAFGGLFEGVPTVGLSAIKAGRGRAGVGPPTARATVQTPTNHPSVPEAIADPPLTFLVEAEITGYTAYLEFVYQRGQLVHRAVHQQPRRNRTYYQLTKAGYFRATPVDDGWALEVVPPGRTPSDSYRFELPDRVIEVINQYGLLGRSGKQRFLLRWTSAAPELTMLPKGGKYQLSEQYLLRRLDEGVSVWDTTDQRWWFAARGEAPLYRISRPLAFDPVHQVVLLVANPLGLTTLPVVVSEPWPTGGPSRPGRVLYQASPHLTPTTVAIPPASADQRVQAMFTYLVSTPAHRRYLERDLDFHRQVGTRPSDLPRQLLEGLTRPTVNWHRWLPERQVLIVGFTLFYDLTYRAYAVRFIDQ